MNDPITTARMRLILRASPETAFFSSILLRFKVVENDSVQTMATDGCHLFYNQKFVDSLSQNLLTGVLIHEALHVAFLHHTRRNHRNAFVWNVACDLAINPVVQECGFPLPEGALLPGVSPFKHLPQGWPAERYYEILIRDAKLLKLKFQAMVGEVLDSVEDPAWTEELWKQEIQARIQSLRGSLPKALKGLEEFLKPSRVSWKSILQRFVLQNSRNEYSWNQPNRRFSHRGLSLPSLRAESLGLLAINIDVSGSTQTILDRFSECLSGILEPFHCEAAISYSNTEILHEERWQTGHSPLMFKRQSGGGTSHHAVMEWAEALSPQPNCLICLTDLYTDFPRQPPSMPVLWAVYNNPDPQAPWGEIIHLDPHGD